MQEGQVGDRDLRTQQGQAGDRHLSRATVVAAIIAALGTITAALIGHRVGQERSADTIAALHKQLTASAGQIDALQNALRQNSAQMTKLQQRLEQLTNANRSDEPIKASGPAENVLTALDRDFEIKLVNCKRSGVNLSCQFMIMNQVGDRGFSILAHRSRVVSNSGDEHFATRIRLGAQVEGYEASTKLPSQVPMRATLEFASVAPDLKVVQVLDIGGHTWDQAGYRYDWGVSLRPNDDVAD